ncbi:hypothetical protein F5884DRAFT_357755 [Xylogone sp. PMI_703]|nr:hypothetical protein F5884DRAFT_357755 [Xylogone sp. PMI_703]
MFGTRIRLPRPISLDTGDYATVTNTRADTDTESIAPLLSETRETNYRETLPSPYNSTRRPAVRVYTWKEQDHLDDDTIVIISVPIVPLNKPVETTQRSRRKSIIGKLKSSNQTKLKIIILPLSECKKHFARDSEGVYRGTEPEREWTAQELEARYGKYRAFLPMPTTRTTPAVATGGYIAPGYGYM